MRLTSLHKVVAILSFIFAITHGEEKTTKLILCKNNPPYYYQYNSTHNTGLLVDMFAKGLIKICGNKVAMNQNPKHVSTHQEIIDIITTENQQELYQKLNYTGLTDEVIIIGPTTYTKIKSINSNAHRMAVMSSNLVLVVPSGELLLLVKFVRTFPGCLIVVFFSIMCAIIFSAIVWIIERVSDNTSFPDTFGAGLWSAFWFSFVTMATVGYGDKVPKHPLSRAVSIVWIVFGLMLVALITSVVLNSINADYPTEGMEIGVLNNTNEADIVTENLYGVPKLYRSYDRLLDDVRKKNIPIALMDENVVAYQFKNMEIKDLKIERIVKSKAKIRFYFFFNSSLTTCEDHDEEWRKDEMETIIHEHVPVHQVANFHVRSILKTFDNTDNGILLGTTLTASAIIFIAIVSQLVNKYRKTTKQQEELKSTDLINRRFEQSEGYKRILSLKQQFDVVFAIVQKNAYEEFVKNDPAVQQSLSVSEL